MEEKILGIEQKLSLIQNEMVVKKNQYNKFGKYSYRSAEDILAEAKKICLKHRCTLVVTDEIVAIEGRFYVKAKACLNDWDSTMNISAYGYAREEESKKGMDASQVTGSCSSYARKYALNGLFNLDDVKDADTNEQHEQTKGSNTNEVLDELRTRCFKAQNSLQKLAIDVRSESFISMMAEKYRIMTQDIMTMDKDSLTKLLNAYIDVYKTEVKKEEK